jgi:hypothetical protein
VPSHIDCDAIHSASPFRAAVAAVVLAASIGGALGACSSDQSGETAAPESGSPDSTSPIDAAANDAASDAHAEAAEAARADATSGGDASHAGEAGDAAKNPDATMGGDGGAVDGVAGDAGEADGDAGASADAGPADAGADACAVGPSGEPIDLSCAHLYSDWSKKTVYSDVVAYDPGLHLWSDGAQKQRWIHLPAGQRIDTSNMDEWTFPVGTQVWKEFSLQVGDASAATRIETRLLWKQAANTWYRTTYRWSADGESSATELTDGELDVDGVGYQIPSQLQCNTCHDGRWDGVLGFEAVSLASRDAGGLTMQALISGNLITAKPDASLAIPGNTTEAAALAYLHANCGTSCHNGGTGAAANSGFYMRLDVGTLANVKATDTYTTGWDQPTHSYFLPDAAVTYRIHACDLATSCTYYRSSLRDGVNGTGVNVQMPPLDTHQVDETGIAAIAAWIDEGCDAGAD